MENQWTQTEMECTLETNVDTETKLKNKIITFLACRTIKHFHNKTSKHSRTTAFVII